MLGIEIEFFKPQRMLANIFQVRVCTISRCFQLSKTIKYFLTDYCKNNVIGPCFRIIEKHGQYEVLVKYQYQLVDNINFLLPILADTWRYCQFTQTAEYGGITLNCSLKQNTFHKVLNHSSLKQVRGLLNQAQTLRHYWSTEGCLLIDKKTMCID